MLRRAAEPARRRPARWRASQLARFQASPRTQRLHRPLSPLDDALRRPSPKPSELLTIGEQEDHVVLEGWSGLEHAHGLEHRRYRCPVVTGAWTDRYLVVVGGDEHVGRRAPRAGHPDDHVLYGAGPLAPHRRLDTTATLDLGGQPERLGPRLDVLAYSPLCSRTDRM